MIQFNFHKVDEFDLSESEIEKWMVSIAGRYSKSLEFVDITICSDEFLKEMNNNYLQHDYYTDILTFDLSESLNSIIGELYISIDRVKENALNLGVSWIDELHRVMAHGVLHMCGFTDEDEVSRAEMRQEEDIVLALRMF